MVLQRGLQTASWETMWILSMLPALWAVHNLGKDWVPSANVELWVDYGDEANRKLVMSGALRYLAAANCQL